MKKEQENVTYIWFFTMCLRKCECMCSGHRWYQTRLVQSVVLICLNVDHFVLSGQHLSFKAFLTHPALSILLLFFFFLFYFSIHHSNPFPCLRGAGLYRKPSGELVTMVTALTVVTRTNIPDHFDDCWLSRHTCSSGNIANFNITTNHSWIKILFFYKVI